MNENVFLFNPLNHRFLSGESRRLRQTIGGVSPVFWLSLLIILIVTNAALVGLDIARLQETEATYASAVETEGMIISCYSGFVNFNVMSVNYSYTVNNPDGSTTIIGGRDDINGVCTSQTDTMPIQIRYLPTNPFESVAVGGNADTRLEVVWRSVTVALYLFGLIAYAYRIIQFERKGRIVQGTIISYSKRRWYFGRYYVQAQYEFTNAAGKILKGKYPIWLRRLKGEPPPIVGTPVAVVYVNDRTFQAL